ncbi:MAG TPA: RluA family pseudouridine synthase, partial [Myxococcaceae bacterium]|nr:RluA family pseudouridine synthase [Myxococcaceae bacterium]
MKRRAFQADAAGPLDAAVARALGCPLEDARILVSRGAVYVRGRRQREAALALAAGSSVLVVL